MKVESGDPRCSIECIASLNKELELLRVKRSELNVKHMQKYRNGSATRSQTTTHNARISSINEDIERIKTRLSAANKADSAGGGDEH